jgi:hypothetical protein
MENLPLPIHYGILASLCMFILLPLMPHEIMSIPIIIGGGLMGGLFLVGENYVPRKILTKK